MKPIGHWYVRKERRGLVCLVIENRHAVDKLKRLENVTAHADVETNEREQPIAFADIFPIAVSNHKRGESPERKFVLAVRSTPRSNGHVPRSEKPALHRTQPGSSETDGDRFLSPSRHRTSPGHFDLLPESDAERVGRSTSPQPRRKIRARSRHLREQATSRLILDVIPHEEADELFRSAQGMSWSTVLEAKAEETIDTLMRRWTYLDPMCFSEHDRSSTSSIEPSLPISSHKMPRQSQEGMHLGPARRTPSLRGTSKERGAEALENGGHKIKIDGNRSAKLPGGVQMPTLLAGRTQNTKKRPPPLLPTLKDSENNGAAELKDTGRTPSGQELQSPKEPSIPAPPYLPSHSGQCPSCHAASPKASESHADTEALQRANAKALDEEARNDASALTDRALQLFEKKILEIMKQPPFQPDAQDAQLRDLHQQPITSNQAEADPVILKDCLKRKFLFSIQACGSWQVSPSRTEQYGSLANSFIDA